MKGKRKRLQVRKKYLNIPGAKEVSKFSRKRGKRKILVVKNKEIGVITG